MKVRDYWLKWITYSLCMSMLRQEVAWIKESTKCIELHSIDSYNEFTMSACRKLLTVVDHLLAVLMLRQEAVWIKERTKGIQLHLTATNLLTLHIENYQPKWITYFLRCWDRKWWKKEHSIILKSRSRKLLTAVDHLPAVLMLRQEVAWI